jgi:predicted P-loop ATPase
VGLLATTNAGGAKKFRPDHATVLARFDCVILPDNDQPGRKHADVVASALRAAGCTSIRVVNLPNLPPKGDVIDWVRAGGTPAEFAEIVVAAPAYQATEPEPEEPQQEPPPDPGDDEKPNADKPWTKYLQRNGDGEAVINLANAMTALRSAPELRDCFRFDEMLQVPVLVSPLPKGKPGILPRPVRDTDVSIVQEWLQRNELRRLGKDIVHQAVALRAEERAFHPIRNYLNGLRWDRKPRLSTWLTYYVGVEPDEKLSDEEKANQRQYISAIGRMFLIGMVARVMRPGCKVDYMLILESIQGEKKSTIGEILAGQWFSDSLPNIGTDPVRISQHLRGKWLIEIGELSAMSKAETEELKAFLTRREEKFTPKYGRLEVIEPRQCAFMGTTNKTTYLRDETGARRFWPAKAGVIDITVLTEDRDQLFAEAVHAYLSDEQWWPDREFEKKFIMPQQEARRETDAWEQTIGDWLETPVRDDTTRSGVAQRTMCTVAEIAEQALRMEPGRLGTTDQRRIAAALGILGWERGKRTEHSRPWIRGTVAKP